MSVDFRVGQFLVPLSILKFRRLFQRMPSAGADEIRAYQQDRLRVVVRHAVENVPYYAQLFRAHGLTADAIRTLEDLRRLPVLSKDVLRDQSPSLMAVNARKFSPQMHRTSGSSGRPIEFYLDRATNGMEFAFYWRYWGWAGYRLGDAFAEFSTSYFLRHPEAADRVAVRQRGTGRLLLNSVLLSEKSCREIAAEIRRHKARFVKGLPSVLHAFAGFVLGMGIEIPLRAVFSTGETLYPHQRRAIESAFGCRILDSYGHMERVIAATDCPEGRMHIHSDYGLMELEPVDAAADAEASTYRARVIGTGLHNLSMPLLRYDVGDIVHVDRRPSSCPCGRNFPLIRRVEGRVEDAVVTPDGGVITTLFLIFEEVRGIRRGRIVQDSVDRLFVGVMPDGSRPWEELRGDIERAVEKFVGRSMAVRVEREENAPASPGAKAKVITSRLHPAPR